MDAYKTIYTLAGLTLIGLKGSDSIGWQIDYTKFVFVLRSENYEFHVFGQTLTDGSLTRYDTQVS